MFRRFAELILKSQWLVLLILILVTIATGVAIFNLRIDPSMDTLFQKNSKEYTLYRDYQQKYGSDQLVVLAMATDGIFKLKNLLLLSTLTHEIEKLPGVDRVLSLANAMDLRHKFLGIQLVPVLENIEGGEAARRQIKESVLSNELFVRNLISTDGKVATLLIHLKPSEKNKGAAGLFIKKLRGFLPKVESPDIRFYMAGAPVEQYDFIDLIRKDQFVFVPIISGLLVLTSLLIYRSFPCMLVSMSVVFMTLIWNMGSIALAGDSLNLMTSLLAPVIMIIAVTNTIHLMNLFFQMRPHNPGDRQCILITMEQLGVPCLLAHVTTTLGFLSLTFDPVPAIQSFGFYAALGTMYSYIISVTLMPLLLPFLPDRRNEKPSYLYKGLKSLVVNYLEKLEFRWKWWIVGLTAAGLVFAFSGIRKLEVDTNLVRQMKPDLPLAIATRFIDDHVTGVYSMAFVLKRRDRRPVTDTQSLRRIDEFKNFLESQPAITKVNSITTLIKEINEVRENDEKAYAIPEDPVSLHRYFEGLSKSSDPELRKLISRDFREVHLEVRIKAVGTREGYAVEEAARQYLKEKFSEGFEFYQTGNVVLLGRMAKDLVGQQTSSFGWAFVSILFVITLFFRSFKMGLYAAIPNLFPILTVYGLMGYLKIELSSTTAMIASIVLGLVVDASIHFLYRYRLEFERRGHYIQSLHHTLRRVGQSLIVSNMILVVGFASSVFAHFRPTIHFGLLTSLTIFLALVCTLVILPVYLILFKPFGRPRLFRHRLKFKDPGDQSHKTEEKILFPA